MVEKWYDMVKKASQRLSSARDVEGLELPQTTSTNNTISWMLLLNPRDVCVVGREPHLSKNENEHFRLHVC